MTVTHELQAPLAAILGWARLLQTKPFDQTTISRALETSERNATIEAKLVERFVGCFEFSLWLVTITASIRRSRSSDGRSCDKPTFNGRGESDRF